MTLSEHGELYRKHGHFGYIIRYARRNGHEPSRDWMRLVIAEAKRQRRLWPTLKRAWMNLRKDGES